MYNSLITSYNLSDLIREITHLCIKNKQCIGFLNTVLLVNVVKEIREIMRIHLSQWLSSAYTKARTGGSVRVSHMHLLWIVNRLLYCTPSVCIIAFISPSRDPQATLDHLFMEESRAKPLWIRHWDCLVKMQ